MCDAEGIVFKEKDQGEGTEVKKASAGIYARRELTKQRTQKGM